MPSRRRLFILFVLCLLLSGTGVAAAGVTAAAAGGDTVTVRRTAGGIPHVLAHDYAALGYGEGYAFTQDNPCALVQQALTLAGDRSRWFGAAAAAPSLGLGGAPPTNVDSDLLYRSVNATGQIERLLATPPPLGPTPQVRALVRGYVRGYNRYLQETGIAHLPDPACRGASWMRPVTELDVWRRAYELVTGVLGGTDQFLGPILAAVPPTSVTVAPTAPLPATQTGWFGSNGLAVGRSVTTDRSGMVLANPHADWTGQNRLYQMQLTIPGRLDVTGATLYGLPLLMPFGHTAHLAFTATAATDTQYTIQRLALTPGDPTSYLVDGHRHTMTRQTVTVPIRQPDGTMGSRTRTLYRTPDGPVIALGSDPWTTTYAYVLHDAQADNLRALNELLAMAEADNLDQLRAAMDAYQGLPTLNVLAADATGRARYVDASGVPHLTDAQAADCQVTTDPKVRVILDGSREACRPGRDPDAIEPGIFGPAELPRLTRTDYVANSNGSPWLVNPAQPLSFPHIVGSTGTDRPPRERLGFDLVHQRIAGTDGLGAPGFTVPTLAAMMLDDREFYADQWRDDLVALCRAHPTMTGSAGTPVDVAAACAVLAGWDRRADIDSRGEVLFREFLAALNSHRTKQSPVDEWYAVPFDPAHPLQTPRRLNTTRPEVSQALADAVLDLAAHHLPVDVALRAVQQVTAPHGVIPVPGCPDGCYNAISPASPTLTAAGRYPDIVGGSTFLMVVELTPRGPRGQTLLTYGESENVASTRHWDQTHLFSAKQWLPDRFTPDQIAADPTLTLTQLSLRSDGG